MYLEKESKNLELKLNTSSSTYLKTVSAFANYQDGSIIFGVADDNHVIGNTNVDEAKLSIENAINDAIHPRPNYTISTETFENKEVIVLKVFKGDHPPYTYKRKAYQRFNTASTPVDDLTFQELYFEGSRISWDEYQVDAENLTFKQLEKSLIEAVKISHLTDDLLKTLGLKKADSYTNSALLLADKSDYKYGLDIVRFGKNNNVFMERRELKGISLLEQYRQALEMFDKWYSPYEKVSGFYREHRIQIPREAFREAIANAIVHRDYILKSNIQVSMREDEIEIVSPGGLLAGITEEAYKQGLYSQIRNETLTEVFHRLNIIEKFGTGIKRIRAEYRDFIDSPELDVIDNNAVRIVLPVIQYQNSEMNESLEKQIMDFINNTGTEVTRAEIQAETGGSGTTVKRALQSLVDNGKINKIGLGRATRYQKK
jgi:ATP-dependent DNA helicase RecG